MTSLVHITDLHFDDVVPGTADALLDAIARIDPDVVVASGDFTMRGRVSEFERAAAFLTSIDAPVVGTPGNHDIPAYHLVERFLRPLRRYRRHIADLAPGQFERDDLVIHAVNTARPWDLHWNWSHGRFSRAQIEATRTAFADAPDDAVRCLVTHHPFVIPDDMPGFRIVGRADAMLEVLSAARVDLVLSGHLHRGFWRTTSLGLADDANPIILVQAATPTSPRQRDQPNAFNHLRLARDHIDLEVWEWTDHAFQPRVRERLR